MKVLIVDDNQLIRMGLRVSLEMQESVSQIFEAENGEEAIAIATREAVDITILDVSMPVMGGLDALEQLIPHCPVVMLDRKSTRLNSSHVAISYAVFCLKKTKITQSGSRGTK